MFGMFKKEKTKESLDVEIKTAIFPLFLKKFKVQLITTEGANINAITDGYDLIDAEVRLFSRYDGFIKTGDGEFVSKSLVSKVIIREI